LLQITELQTLARRALAAILVPINITRPCQPFRQIAAISYAADNTVVAIVVIDAAAIGALPLKVLHGHAA